MRRIFKNPFAPYIRKKKFSEPAKHAKRLWKKKNTVFGFSNSILALSLLFLFVPLFVIVFFSFNEAKDTNFTRVSFVWYQKLFLESDDLWRALFNSLLIAISSSMVATILGTLAAIGVGWYKFKGRSYIQTTSFLPMVLPEVIMGVSLLIFFSGIKMSLGLFTIFIAHTTFCLPFVYLMVSARIDEFDYTIIEASHDVAGFMVSVTMSLEDYVITSLVSGPGSTTLPLYVYSMIRFGVSPVINSLSFILILVICVITFVLRKGVRSFAAAH